MDGDATDFTLRAAVAAHVDALLAYPNVFAVGVGRRVVDGQRTDEPAVVVYVSRKLPAAGLRVEELIPRELVTDAGEAFTDVIEAAPPRFGADTAAYDPRIGGCQIGRAGRGGTLGGFMYDAATNQPVVLTCNHVLTDTGARSYLPSPASISQPAGGTVVGDGARIVPWFPPPLGAFTANLEARVDAGIATLRPTTNIVFDVIDLGRHPYVVLPAYEGLSVSKRGATTKLTTGTVETVDLYVVVKDFDGKTVKIGGSDAVFSIRSASDNAFFLPGDSGSLVIDAEGGATRGLAFAGDFMNGGLTWACDITAVMEELNLETPCSGGLNGLIRRAVFRRYRLAWAAAEMARGTAAASSSRGAANALVAEAIRVVDLFRSRYLPDQADGTFGGALGSLFANHAAELAEAVYADEDFAGLLDQTFGDLLTQPTVYDMLEWRPDESFGRNAVRAFDQLRQRHPHVEGIDDLLATTRQAAGLSMRDLLRAQAATTA